jgi:outer membrane protein assembly factor BamE (lipoprotein component of BamABCDE complex)
MKLITIFITLFLFIVFSCTNLKQNSSEKENQINLEKVRIGMKERDVIEIMGIPDTILIDPLKTSKSYYWYMYKAPFGMSDNFYIFISKQDSVVEGISDGN